MLVFFTDLSLMEFRVRYLVLFLLFSVIDSFEWFWMESFHKNVQLMLEFLKDTFLVVHFSYYTLMIFLMTLPSILGVVRYLIWQELELSSELESDLQDTVDWGKKRLVISMLGKCSWFRLTGIITMVLLMSEWMGLLTVFSYHVTYAFQSESTLCSCLIVKELLARGRHKIWRNFEIWMGLFLRKNHLFRCWAWSWPSVLNWIGTLTLSLLLKLPPRKLEL